MNSLDWVPPTIPGAERIDYELTESAEAFLDHCENAELDEWFARDDVIRRRQVAFILWGSVGAVILVTLLAIHNLWGIW